MMLLLVFYKFVEHFGCFIGKKGIGNMSVYFFDFHFRLKALL